MMNRLDQNQLHRLLKNLFQKWQLTDGEQEKALGLPLSKWGRASAGDIQEINEIVLARAISLLEIHRLLRVLFPENAELRYQWITTSNRGFDQRTPLSVLSEGLQGMASVVRYLEAATQV